MADKHQVIASQLMGWDTDASHLHEPITSLDIESAAALAHSSSHSVPAQMRGSKAMHAQPNIVTEAQCAQSSQVNISMLIQGHSILQQGQYSHSCCNVPPTPKHVVWTCLNANCGH